jgi:hypothetical protein
MPISIDELETRVDVQTSDQPHEPPRTQPQPHDLPRWQQLARREAELALRTAAWDFDD